MLLRWRHSRYRTIRWMLFLGIVGSVALFFCSYHSYLQQQRGQRGRIPQKQQLHTEPFHVLDASLDYDDKNGVTKTKSGEKSRDRCSNVSLALRVDCHPDLEAGEQRCLSRGCCWQAGTGVGIPPCYVPIDYVGYKLVSEEATPYGLYLTLLRSMPSGLPGDTLRLNVEIGKYDVDTVRVRITDRDVVRYEPPVPVIGDRRDGSPARFQVYLTDDGAVLIRGETNVTFRLGLSGLIFSEFCNQLAVDLPATIVYGLRSENESFFTSLRPSRHVFFADGKESIASDTENDVPVFYGGHPFLILLHGPSNVASGVFLFNSNHLEVQLTEGGMATFRTTGGILDFFIFLGPSLASVVTQYQKVVGFPGLPPRSLLRHRWENNGYQSLGEYITTEMIAEAHNRLSLSKRGWNISFDHKIVVQNKDGRPARCLAADANTRYLIDFTHPATTYFWMEVLVITKLFTVTSPYRTIDLQVPSCPGVSRDCRVLHRMPYLPPGVSKDVDDMLCPTNVLHYSTYRNLHHTYPYLQAKTTIEALVGLQRRRQGILSDRTFPGQGRWSGYWVRHPEPTWKGLATSLGDMLRYSMYGIPLFGTNLCNPNATVERLLCVAQLGLATFFPVFRGVASSQNETVPTDSFYKDAVSLRNFLHPYLYTLVYRSSYYGEMVARPMAFEFQQDPKTHSLQHQFMWGAALLVVPKMLEQSGSQLDVYFPRGTWFDWHTGRRIESKGQRTFVPAPLVNKPGMFLRSGSILPGEGEPLNDRNSLVHIVIAPDKGDYASGNMYVDDGRTLYTVERKDYSYFNFFYMKNVVTGHCSPCKYRSSSMLTKVTVFGVRHKPQSVLFNSRKVQFIMAGTTMYVTQLKHRLMSPFTLLWQ